jgi:predicted transcriptional regulator
MLRTQIQFTDDQSAALSTLAGARGQSVAAIVRDAVDSYLETTSHLAARERMIASVGGFRSGDGKLAGRHDDALTDAFA